MPVIARCSAAHARAPRRSHRVRGSRWRVARHGLCLAVLVALVSWPVAASAGSHAADPGQRLAEVERRLGQLERTVDELSEQVAADAATLDERGDQLDVLAARMEAAQAREREAARAADDARVRAQQAGEQVGVAEVELRRVEDQLGELARRAYVHGRTTVDPVMVAIGSLDASGGELADRLHYLERTVGAQAASVEAATGLTVRLEALRELAAAEQAAAEEAAEHAATAADEVSSAHAEVLELTGDASRVLADGQQRLAEAERQRDELAAEQEQLRATLASEQEAREATAQASRGSRSSAGAPAGGLVTVRGITVAAAIGPALEALLDAAAADGIALGGSGYRSPEVTARLRRANGCPDVYESPASACRIPTARPGTSEHETGLAIDFTWRGQTICYPRPAARCSGNAAFDWLRANAARFGFHNLPSEAWHWSTTGR